jgi:hypothetical protein
MKWLLIVAGALVLLVVVIAIVGVLLPQNHVASRRARYAKAPSEVFAVITDFGGLSGWRKGLKQVEVRSANEWRENGEMTLRVEERVPPTRLVTRIQPGLPFGGTWTYELTAEGDGTVLRITENGEVYNPIFRFVSRFVLGHTATLDGYLTQLGAKLGERAVIVD